MIGALDPAILRPGRLDEHLAVPPPAATARAQIMRTHAAAMAVGLDVDFEALAAGTEGFSGAELRNVCREAGLCCVRDEIGGRGGGVVSAAHFGAALARSHSVARAPDWAGR
jgi:transitional endoplasmic reticulum ATPase